MKTRIYSILIIFLVLAVACNEDEFFDKEYKNAIVDINFLTQPSHADQAVIGIYDALGYQGLWKWGRIILGSSTSDEVVEDHNDPGWVDLVNLDKFRWYPTNSHIWEHWSDNYSGILMANAVIEKVPGITAMDATLAKRYVAEAKTLRALFYYNLVTTHGDVPLYTVPLTAAQAKEITRQPESQVWQLIINDLNEAKNDLPDTYSNSQDKGRVNKATAQTLLSTVYLWKKDYAKSASEALDVINSPVKYTLEPEYADLFNGVREFSKERIFAANCASGLGGSIWVRKEDDTNRAYLMGPFFNWSWFIQPARSFIDPAIAAGDSRIDTVTLDIRTETYDINNDGKIDALDAIPPSPPGDARVMKYTPANENLKDGPGQGKRGWVDVHIVRYADVLLNYAEALNEQNRGAEALPYLNQLRKRARLADITETNQQKLRDIILYERMCEFCFEGRRFFDLKRTGRLAEFLGTQGFVTGRHENFPIPQSEIDLTKMTQNPNY